MERDTSARGAIARASVEDADTAIRHVARGIVEHGRPHILRRKRALRSVRRKRRQLSTLEVHC
jgi:hypothetical protein